MTEDEAAGYLAGLIDGEGNVYFRRIGKRQQWQRQVRIFNTETDILDAAQAACDVLGVRCHRYTAKRRAPRMDLGAITISDQGSIERLAARVSLGCSRKRVELDAMAVSYVQRHRLPRERA